MEPGDLTPNSLDATELTRATPLTLTGRQKALFLALEERDGRLASLYLGACMVLSQTENPARKSLAAHAFRELVDKLPIYIDIPQPTKPANLKAKVQELRDTWDRAKKKSDCCTPDGWTGSVDKPLEVLLGEIGSFFDWFAKERATRYERTAVVVRALDASEHRLPERIEKLRVAEWDEHYGYFAGVSHQGSAAEFDGMVEALESLLLQTLKPKTFDDHADIDDLIAEGESNA